MQLLRSKTSVNAMGCLYFAFGRRAVYKAKAVGGGWALQEQVTSVTPARRRWMLDTCFFLKGYWHRFCLAGLVPPLGASNTPASKNTASELVHCTEG